MKLMFGSETGIMMFELLIKFRSLKF